LLLFSYLLDLLDIIRLYCSAQVLLLSYADVQKNVPPAQIFVKLLIENCNCDFSKCH